ncbi:DUF6596 domain-containing protein, partial [Blastomonas sp.]|uniref:DUF6596 domain-containing protein n=1 Tax=Blastomonas sp. TaxID=1909299 RepID=UPI0035943AC4
ALAALVQLAESRRSARLDADGAMVPLSQQDPQLWDERLIASASRLMARAADIGRSGPYQLLAAIHLTHARRKGEGATDWAAILALYDMLQAVRPGRVVAINRAIALGRVQGPVAALQALDALDASRLQAFRPWHAARAHLFAELGQHEAARAAWAAALALNPPRAERLYLEARLQETSA